MVNDSGRRVNLNKSASGVNHGRAARGPQAQRVALFTRSRYPAAAASKVEKYSPP